MSVMVVRLKEWFSKDMKEGLVPIVSSLKNSKRSSSRIMNVYFK